jgi:hypothetical protein
VNRPFFVIGTPRSRTAWLSAFLSTPNRPCQHEPSRFLRDHGALLALLRVPDAAVSDSALTFRWRDIARECPGARVVVVRRPIAEVMESAEAVGLARTPKMLRRLAHEIDLLCGRLAVLSVPFHRLADQRACEMVYEFCHGAAAPVGHWALWKDRNIQADIPRIQADVQANMAGVRALFPEMVAA